MKQDITTTKGQKINHIHSKMKKLLIAMFALLVLAVPSVCAMTVSVDDVVAGSSPLSVVAGSNLPIEVTYSVTSNYSDVVVVAELSYGHGKEIEVSTDPVDAYVGTLYKKSLNMQLKNDLETTSTSEGYTLSVRLKDGKGKTLESAEYRLALQRKNDLVEVQRVMMPSYMEAGKVSTMTVVLKNIGSDKQEDVYVTVSSPELGLFEEARARDLMSMDGNEDKDVATISLPLRLPKEAVEGAYAFKIRVRNDNVDFVTTKTVSIKGMKKAEDSTEAVSQIKSLDLKQGKSGVYRISLLNLGNAARTYKLTAEGIEGWASVEVNPLEITLGPKASQSVDVTLSVSDKALVGEHAFTVKVKTDDKVVREVPLTADVKKSTFEASAMLVSVVVLAIVLLVLVVVLVKSRKSDEETEVEESYY